MDMYENYSVLFVDDEEGVINALKRVVAYEEYKSYFASSGQEALEIIKKTRIDVLISDMRMPEMDGLHLMRLVKDISPHTVKMILSGYTQMQQFISTINQVDIFRFIPKPWRRDIVDAIKEALDYFIMREKSDKYRDVLENQNKFYKMLIKKMENTIKKSKNDVDNIYKLGRAMCEFHGSFGELKKTEFQKVFNIQDEIYIALSKALLSDKNKYEFNEIHKILEDKITKLYSLAKVETSNKFDELIIINIKLYEALIFIVIKFFEHHIEKWGLYTKIKNGIEDFEVRFVISNIHELVQKEKDTLDLKMEFLNYITKNVIEKNKFKIEAQIIEKNLLIEIKSKKEGDLDEKDFGS